METGHNESPPTLATVVVVDDNEVNLALFRHILARRPGLDVLLESDGQRGLDLIRQRSPDLGGDQVLQQLRDDPATTSIPVVILSADATPGQVQRLLSAGASAYLTKPFDVRELLRIVDDTLTD